MTAALSYRFPGSVAEQWLTIASLAEQSGISSRALQLACKRGDLVRAHRWRDNPLGGPKLLEVNLLAPTCPARYRDAVAEQERHAQEHGQVHQLTDKQRAKAAGQAASLEEIERITGGTASNRELESLLNLHRRTNPFTPKLRNYFNLRKRWIEGGRTILSLADGRARVREAGGSKVEFDQPALDYFIARYLTQNQLQATECYRDLLREAGIQGWQVPANLTTVKRRLDQVVPKDRQVFLRQGPKAHADHHEVTHRRDWSKMKANDRWVSDHCLLDVMGIDDLPGAKVHEMGLPCRMWLTTWMDEASRYIVGWLVHRGPNAQVVGTSLYRAIMAGGIPLNILIDNGKEYRSKRFSGGRRAYAWVDAQYKVAVDELATRSLCQDLGITPHFANPYGARSKIVEPWHKHIVKERFSRWQPGFCGGNTQEKPEQLDHLMKHWEKTGEGLMPWSELIQRLEGTIATYHAEHHHESLNGMTPEFVRQQKLAEISLRVADERTAALFMEPRVITCGTCLSIDGYDYGVGDLAIIERQGEKLRVRLDEQNAGIVYVYDLAGRYICTAKNNGLTDAMATRDDLVEANHRIKSHNKMVRQIGESAALVHSIQPAAFIARERISAEQDLAAPASFKPDFTPRADDGSRLTPKALPASAPAGDPVIGRLTQGTDSSDSNAAPEDSLKDIWGILDAG